jgi:RNA polymerase sigma factor (sigma-70 family)
VIYTIANQEVGVQNADDVYQEVRLRIAQYISAWRGEGELLNWIKGITRNVCIDFHRTTKPNWLFVTDTFTESQIEPDQFRRISARETLKIAHTTLQDLKEECQRFLRMHLLEGIPKKEIMAEVNLPRNTFYTRWNKCYYAWMRAIQKILQS